MKDTFRSVVEYKNTPTVFILVSDQVPSNRQTAIAVDFFGQRTACLPGTESIAKSNNYPVFMYEIQRLKRGYYELSFSEICLDPSAAAHGEITQKFMSRLEETIREHPSSWLWSHKRWKWQPE
jgi:Kdo2-lipid IVA lauroyltransferase/acyltransferase